MLLKYFYDEALSHASYLVGCQRSGEAIAVDPGRDIDRYLAAAAREGLRITAVAETHIHADFVSGARELAARVGSMLYVSDEGPAEWKYIYVNEYPHRLLHDGDRFAVGNIQFEVLHTPGHTPESVSYLVTDRGGGADQPMGVFTGDFVFVGSIGRPDLLQEAAGIAGTAEPGARELFRSIQRFRRLPDYLQVWPSHGAGSACGKGLGAIPSTTVGYEKLFNPALQYSVEQEFVEYILSEQPEPPRYFALMKRINKEGPSVLGNIGSPQRLSVEMLRPTVDKYMVVDTCAARRFAEAHVPGTINIETKYLAMWGGSLIDYSQPLFLIASERDSAEAIRICRNIGIESFGGVFDSDEVSSAGLRTDSIPQETPQNVIERIRSGDLLLIDVRGQAERSEAHVEGSSHQFLGKILDRPPHFDRQKSYAFMCRSGGRSMIASSIARRLGAQHVINVAGGIDAWVKAGLPVAHGGSALETVKSCSAR